MPSLIPVNTVSDVLANYRGTAVERLLRYHNLKEPLPPTSGTPEMLIGMCMDHRKDLTIPSEFAYVLRTAGGNLRDSGFEISYAVAIGGVQTIALLAHTDCGMAHVTQKRDAFVRGLVDRAGWKEPSALMQFTAYAAHHEIGDPVQFALTETMRLRAVYPRVMIAPLLYTVEDDRLMQIGETS
jgi:carbonic anhydrase